MKKVGFFHYSQFFNSLFFKMPDVADRAEAYEEQQRADSIERVTHRTIETPMVDTDGGRICRDCEQVIPFTRVLAVPHAVRCYDCQVQLELGKG